jgi:hypothetical protein
MIDDDRGNGFISAETFQPAAQIVRSARPLAGCDEGRFVRAAEAPQGH